MTASKHAKARGLKGGLQTMSNDTGVSRPTLNNWFRNKPVLFDVVIDGCLVAQERLIQAEKRKAFDKFNGEFY